MILHQNVLGVDVAKDWIDVFDPATNAARRIATRPRALKAFAAGLASNPMPGGEGFEGKGVLVVFEASGGYERPLAEALEAAGVAYSRVNPARAREFARAAGRLAKTDKVDARVLAEMGRALGLKPTPPADPARQRLAALIARREDLVAAVTAETNRLAQARDRFIRADIQGHLAVLKRRLKLIDAEIAEHKRDHRHLSEIDRRLRTVPGVGPVIAGVLAALLPELGRLDRRAIASLAGLAPHACESGQHRGKRRVWGGRADVRKALYRAAFIASRHDPGFKAVRDAMTQKGKPLKVILIAIARKLLVAINAVVRDNRDFKPKTT